MNNRIPKTHLLRAASAALCLSLVPAVALAQTAPRSRGMRATDTSAPGSLVGSWEVGGGVGLAVPFETGMDAGFKLNLDAFYGVMRLAPNLVLQLGGNFGWTYNGFSGGGGSFNTFDFLPTARLRFAVAPQVFVFGDLGMGLAVVGASFNGIPPFVPSTSSTDVAFLMKLGGGVGYSFTPQLALTFEPAFNFYVKSGSITQFTMLVGMLYRI